MSNETEIDFEEFCNGKVENADARATSRTILDQGPEDRSVLVMDKGDSPQAGVRSILVGSSGQNESQSLSAPMGISTSERTNTGGDEYLPSLRQPSLRETRSSIHGDPATEPSGHEGEGQSQRPVLGDGKMPSGPRTQDSPESTRTDEAGMQNLCKPTESESKKVSQPKPNQIQATSEGVLVGTSFEDEYRLARAYHASGLMPKSLNSVEKVLVALQLCRELNLPPMSSLGKIMVVNGVVSIFGDLPLALVHRSGRLAVHKEEFIDKEGQAYSVTCTVQRTGMPLTVRTFTIDDAKKAGLFKNDIWNKYPRRMLQCRARAWALKDAFPDVLSGVSIAEYDFNTTQEKSVESEVASNKPVSALNALLDQTEIAGEKNESAVP